jgi:serine protease AprX
MSKRFVWGLCAAVFSTACADNAVAPVAASPGAPRSALGDASTDLGADLVAAEWAAFRARPGMAAGTHVLEPALGGLLQTVAATTQLQVIVSYDPAQTTGGALAARLHGLGVGTVRLKHLPMVFALATPAAVRQIVGLPGVESVYQNRRLRYLLRESTKAIKADAVWTFNGPTSGYTGRGVGVMILDSGVDGLTHPGLRYGTKTVANVKVVVDPADLVTLSDTTPRLAGALYAENVPTSETSSGHGTHVAGIVGGDGGGSPIGIYRGVAPGANLVGMGTGDGLNIFWALAGFDWLLDHKDQYNIKAVNNSWGTSGEFDPNDPTNKATYQVYKAGVSVIFAAGNAGPGENTLNPYSAAPWVLSVAAGCKVGVEDPTNSAADCADDKGRAPVLGNFSSRGIPGDALYHPDVTAPGVRIVSARSPFGPTVGATAVLSDALDCNIAVQSVAYYTCLSGTSMAAPHVAGVVALLQEAAANRLTPDQVYGVLKKTSRPLAGYGEWEVGNGFVDAYEAVRRVRR